MQFKICVVFFYAAFLRPEVLSEVEAAGIPFSSSSCSLPPMPRHGRYSVSHYDKPIVPGDLVETTTVLTYSCTAEGYQLSHSNKFSVCEGNNKWSALPGCYKTCTLRSSYTLEYSCFSAEGGSVPCRRNMLYGSSVHFTCKTGHVLSGTQKLVNMRCREDGLWSVPLPDCQLDCGRENPEATRLIVNAPVAERDTVPWNVAVFKKDGDTFDQICGGTILNSRVVISAAHCFYGVGGTEAVELFRVAANKHFRQWGHRDDAAQQTSEVKQIRLHERYRGEELNQASDLALLILRTHFKFSATVSAICYDLQDEGFDKFQLATNTMGKVAGWGLTENRTPSDELRVLRLPVIEDGVCRVEFAQYSFNRYFTFDKFCGGYKNGTAVCNGDSGAGLVFLNGGYEKKWFLRGIVSTAPRSLSERDNNCRENTYTAFTRVFALRDWILSELGNISLQREDYQGDLCTVEETGQPGKCLQISECPVAYEAALKSTSPQNCGFNGTVASVCCPEAIYEGIVPGTKSSIISNPVGDGSNCTMQDTGAAGACTRFANCRVAIAAASEGILPQKCAAAGDLVCCPEPCPPLSRGLVSQQRSGSKAADYCIGLSEKLFPCQQTRFGWTRGEGCSRRTPEHNSTAEASSYGRLGRGDRDDVDWLGSPATLLSDRWVVCSAWIIEFYGAENGRFVGLGGGYTSPFTPEAIYSVTRALLHPEYNRTYSEFHHDIALLQVDRQVTFTSRVLPACLHTGFPLPAGGLTLTGWNSRSSTLVQAKMETVARNKCSRVFSWLPGGVQDPFQFCTRPVNVTGGCGVGWSGGAPLTLQNGARVACTSLLVGTAIRYGHSPCTGLYTRMSAYIPWIEGILWP